MSQGAKIVYKNFVFSYYIDQLVYSFYSVFLLVIQKQDFFGFYAKTI